MVLVSVLIDLGMCKHNLTQQNTSISNLNQLTLSYLLHNTRQWVVLHYILYYVLTVINQLTETYGYKFVLFSPASLPLILVQHCLEWWVVFKMTSVTLTNRCTPVVH